MEREVSMNNSWGVASMLWTLLLPCIAACSKKQEQANAVGEAAASPTSAERTFEGMSEQELLRSFEKYVKRELPECVFSTDIRSQNSVKDPRVGVALGKVWDELGSGTKYYVEVEAVFTPFIEGKSTDDDMWLCQPASSSGSMRVPLLDPQEIDGPGTCFRVDEMCKHAREPERTCKTFEPPAARDTIVGLGDLAEAISFARPCMENTRENAADIGSHLLISWSNHWMETESRTSDEGATADDRLARAQARLWAKIRDLPDADLSIDDLLWLQATGPGSAGCVGGKIVKIAKNEQVSDRVGPFSWGFLSAAHDSGDGVALLMNAVEFYAVGNTGTLAADDDAEFCGVYTGTSAHEMELVEGSPTTVEFTRMVGTFSMPNGGAEQ
jgi:hypothetical protein